MGGAIQGRLARMSLSLNTEMLAARYRLDHLIASGGMGEVWRAVDLVLDRPVAVKLLHAQYARDSGTMARFRAEARHAANLSHPSIAQVYDFGEAMQGRPAFLVMELIAGPPLTQVLARGPLPPARVLDVVAQVAAGLAAAHAAGVVHRDIKPGNLLVDRSGTVKITDFGIAYALGSAPLTRTGTLIGTPAYLAPERVNGQAAGPASDLYSLGMVAYECLTGSLPFAGTAVEIALAHQHQSLPPLPAAVPRELVGLIAFLTARDPARRPASAGVVAARARALADTISGPLPGAGAGSQGADAGISGSDGWAPASPSDMPDRTLTDIPYAGSWDAIGMAGGHDGRGRPPLARRPRRRGAAFAAASIAVVASLAGWAFVTASGSAPPPGHAPRSHGSKAAARTVTVDAAALLGQPVSTVVGQLHQLGLQVDLVWQPGHDQKPGTVLSVQPSGNVLAGTPVVVTATQPNGDHHGHGGNGNGQGGD
jgi:eukaryotic-like serine/threonine-protein kinase